MAALVKADGIAWKPWERDEYPNWSLPALEAAKCAALQSETALDAMHGLLFHGFFARGINIADHEGILVLAKQAPIDYARFVEDFESGWTRRAIFQEYEDAVNHHMIYAIPTVIFPGGERVVGAVPIEEYEKILDKLSVS